MSYNYKILIINQNHKELDNEIKELTVRGLNVIGANSFEEAKQLMLENGSIHVLLCDTEVPLDKNSGKTITSKEVFNSVKNLRPEINLFLFTTETDFSKNSTNGLLDGYFCKKDNDFDDIVKKITTIVISSKNQAPFYETLVEYAKKSKDSWHTPGHSSGYSVKNSPYARDFYNFFGENSFTGDVSVSVPMLDSLMHPVGVIKEAQDLAANSFGSRYTFFSTNGTSTSNKILLQTLLKPGDAILLDRNCHKSVHYAVIITGAEPIYLMPSVNNKYGIFGPIPKKRIVDAMDKTIAEGKKLKVIIITNSTYDGLISDIPYIVKEAHKRGIKVIVDEAWFGYANFHHEFYPSAMAAGADYSTQSTHKTMSAFSQASMIHVQDPDFENIRDFFMENFCMHTSTSPQYPMIASLDVARKQMAMEGYTLLKKNLELSESLRKSINSLKKFRVLELKDLISEDIKKDNVRLDKTKLTIDISQSGFSSREIEKILLTKHNIQIEKSTFNTITVLITIGSTYSKLNRLYLALENIEKKSGSSKSNRAIVGHQDFKLTLSEIKIRPRFAFYCEGETMPIKKAINRVSTRMVTPYPPGIPLLVPGQIITSEIVETLISYRDYGVEIHGLDDNLIQVMTEKEETELKDVNLNLSIS